MLTPFNPCIWNFGNESGSDDGPNDALAENFNSRPTMSLVREAIQNSLDAAIDDSCVKVVFSFGEFPLSEVPNLLDIEQHIRGCLRLYKDNDNALEYFPPMLEYIRNLRGSINYIKVSDYNTIGMNYTDEVHTKEPFYAFVRSKGVTVKRSRGSGGSFGFGKAAYFGMSKLKTVLISTRTTPKEGSKAFFEGVASLCTHLINGEKKTAVGFYDNNNGMPVSNESNIPYKFVRPVNEPGTDFWIMGYDSSEKQQISFDMMEAVLRNFWYAIYSEKLVVVVDGDEINASNLLEKMEIMFPSEHDKSTSLRENYNPRPYLEAVMKADRHNPKYQCITKKLDSLKEVRLYAYLNKEGSNKILLTRKPKMLVQLKNASPIGVYAVFTCDNEDGNELLKSMENPAHTLWMAGRKKETQAAYQELDKFLTETISSLRPDSGKKSLPVMGLADLTWIPENLIPEDTEIDEELEEGNLRLTDKTQDEEAGNQTPVKKRIGTRTKTKADNEVIEKGKGAGIDEPDDYTGESADGTGSGGPGEDPGHEGGTGDERPTIGPGSFDGPFEGGNQGGSQGDTPTGPSQVESIIVKVGLRQYAITEKGEMVHHLTIYSPKDIPEAILNVKVSTEDGYVEQPLKWARLDADQMPCLVNGNKVCDVPLAKGPNKISVRFFDHIKHSIKLIVNELN